MTLDRSSEIIEALKTSMIATPLGDAVVLTRERVVKRDSRYFTLDGQLLAPESAGGGASPADVS